MVNISQKEAEYLRNHGRAFDVRVRNKHHKDAKGSIDELNQYIKDNGIDKDSDLGKKYIESIQEQAKKTGILNSHLMWIVV